ncbi:MAG TPA: phosphoribosylanthranilate isomerase [Solirubrobacteraceae bacterium]|jgi:phosphoribosylanthranilate isomerase|nr:phosphoribosylanthranilate isomerase [Solirubrobacteraceae bacterium]
MSDVGTHVKICGITRLADAELAVELGAWAVGMVFFKASPRSCSLAEAQRITAALRRRAELCGVFVNAPMEEIVGVSEQLGLTLLQLHGDEGPSFCGEAARRTGARVIKALQVSGPGDIRDAARFHTDFHLLDARSAVPGRELLRGGTGETFDWRLLAGRRSKVPLILSGGLGPENVTEAIERVRPFAVDSASGTESAPGLKDQSKLGDFFAAVERAAFDSSGESATQAGSSTQAESVRHAESATQAESMTSAESVTQAEPAGAIDQFGDGAPSVGSPA